MKPMLLLHSVVLGAICISLAACSPLTRGFTREAIISTGLPAVTMSSSLPTMAEGRGSAFVRSEEGGMVTPDYWLRVSGSGHFRDPMTVMMYTTAPDGYEWCPPSASFVDNEEIGKTTFDGASFAIVLRTIDAAKDPFGPMFFSSEELASPDVPKTWLIARFVDVSANHWRTKLIMEYREPLPPTVTPGTKATLYLTDASIREFIARAEKAFTFSTSVPAGVQLPRAPFFNAGITRNTMGFFIGTLAQITPPLTMDAD